MASSQGRCRLGHRERPKTPRRNCIAASLPASVSMGSATCETKRRRDLVQRVMLLTIGCVRSVRETDQIGSFILGVSRTMAVDVKRRERRRERLREAFVVEPVLPASHVEAALDHERLESCLGRLGDRERMIVLLTFYAERSARQVGEEMTMTEGTCAWPGTARSKAPGVRQCSRGSSMAPRCDAQLSDDDLLDYWTHAIEGADADRIEEHLFSCGDCAARLETMASLERPRGARQARTCVRHRLAFAAQPHSARRRAGAALCAIAGRAGTRVPPSPVTT